MSSPETGLSMMPYPGLRPFRRDETDIFFGREEQVDQLLEKLSQTRFLGVVGASGCGKSSLVRAGMISAMEAGFMATAGARWCYATLRPGSEPMNNLAEALLTSGVLADKWARDENSAALVTAALRRGPKGLIELLREASLPADTNLLVLVDQFEEIFRFHALGDSAEAAAFVKLLLATAAEQGLPVYVVITMRSDFLGDCAVFTGLPEALNQGQFLTPRMSREQCQAAIMGPAAIFGGEIEPALVNHILNDMGTDPDQLPLMQHALSRAWSHASSASQRLDPTRVTITRDSVTQDLVITDDEFQQLGGLARSLSNHADEAFAELSAPDERVAEVLFRCLSERSIGQRDTRRPVVLGDVAKVAGVPLEAAIRVVEVFRHPDRSFLMPPQDVPLQADSVIDISHESLIRQWTRMKEWVEKEAESARDYRRLLETSRLWDEGRAGLWSTPDLENALAWRDREQPTAAWAERYGGGFELAMRFIDASVAAKADREQRDRAEQRQRQLRTQLAIVGASIVIAAVILVVWSSGKRRSEEEKGAAILKVYQQSGETLAESADLGLLETVNRLEMAVQEFEGFVNARGNPSDLRELLTATCFNIGNMAETQIGLESISFYEKALKVRRDLLNADPDDPKLKEDLAFTINKIGAVYLQGRVWDEASKAFTEAATLRRELVRDNPNNVKFNRLLASSIMNLGIVARQEDDLDTAQHKYEEASEIREKFLGSKDPQLLLDYSNGQLNLALVLQRKFSADGNPEDLEQAEQYITAADQAIKQLAGNSAASPELRHIQAKLLQRLGDIHGLEKNFNFAIEEYEQAMGVIAALTAEHQTIKAYADTKQTIERGLEYYKKQMQMSP